MKKRLMISILGMMILLVSLVSAFGVARSYWRDNPLRVYPGESVVVDFRLQNTDLNGDVTVTAELLDDAEGMASLSYEDKVYTIPEGTTDTRLPISITVPTNAQTGDTFNVLVRMTEVAADVEGTVVIGTGSSTGFPIVITSQEDSTFYKAPVTATPTTPAESSGSNTLWYVIIALVIIVLIIYFRSRKK